MTGTTNLFLTRLVENPFRIVSYSFPVFRISRWKARETGFPVQHGQFDRRVRYARDISLQSKRLRDGGSG